MTLHSISRKEGLVYRQISEILEREIRELYEAGDAIPPETELAARFSVNRHTVRRAVEELIDSGLLERRHGKGTFVLSSIEYPIGPTTRFTEALSAKGHSTDSHLIRKLVIPASGGVAQRLEVEPGDDVIWLETLREVEAQPFCIVSHFLSLSRLAAVFDNYTGGSLHQFLSEQLHLKLKRRESLITAVLPMGNDASLLNMPTTQPVLRSKSLNLDARTGQPVEYAVTRFRADRVQIRIEP